MTLRASLALALGAILGSYLGDYQRQINSSKILADSPCTSHLREAIIVEPSIGEQLRGALDAATVTTAVEVFQSCGVLAISSAISGREATDFLYHASNMAKPLLESRERVQAASYKLWNELTEELQTESFLTAGEALRERQSGRLDLLLPHTLPFNSSGFTLNRYALPILRGVFGGEHFELKSEHFVTALPGTRAQHWHRDDAPLFRGFTANGAQSVYAVNVFVALEHVSLEAGPTEYLLGSHLMNDTQVDRLLRQPHTAAAFSWPQGSIVLMDYRTAHRGGANGLSKSRNLAMLVFGRPWWRDAVNYMGDNYGGYERSVQGPVLADANGGGYAPETDAKIVARRLAQRSAGNQAQQVRDRESMYEHCRRLWHGS